MTAFPISGRLIDFIVQDKTVLRRTVSLQIILYGSSQAIYNFKLTRNGYLALDCFFLPTEINDSKFHLILG